MSTYWSNEGKYEKENDILWKLIPGTGSVSSPRGKNKNLEKYRRACKMYYDLNNNGLANCARGWSSIFGFKAQWVTDQIKYCGFRGWDEGGLSKKIESVMDEVIEGAWEEQMESKLA
jgi:hypothetical protein